jgi:acetyl esterase
MTQLHIAQLPVMHLPATPWIDPQMAPILARMRSVEPVDYTAMSHQEGQRLFHAAAAYWNKSDDNALASRTIVLETPTGRLSCRLYPVKGPAPDALILHVHGGGWTFGSPDSHDLVCQLLASDTQCPVLSLDYRLAPAHPSPAAVEDVLLTLDAVCKGALGNRLRPNQMVVVGDSAGANLALGALIRRRDTGHEPLAGGVLFYGCYAPVFDTSSHIRFGSGEYGLSSDRMRWYWNNHLGGLPEDDPVAAPLHANLSGLPPLYLNAAGLDPLLDDTLMLASRLAHAGHPAQVDIIPGVVHGFMQMSNELPAARQAITRAAKAIRQRFSAAMP